MSEEPLKVGDRVRYKSEMVELRLLHPRKLELTGKILRLPQGQEKGYLVKWNDVADSETTVHGSWLESVPPSGRTFEEICKELAEHPLFKTNYELRLHEDCAEFLVEREEYLTCEPFMAVMFSIDSEGGAMINEATAEELAAISAACTEIAANWEAEHGKENQQ